MYDHIHRQIAQGRIADQSRRQSFDERKVHFPGKSPPWIRRAIGK
jgi:hypothetical protein